MRIRAGRSGVLRLAAATLGAAAAVAVLAALLSRLYVFGADGPITNPTDFRAFYCGGAALAHGANPYRVEPLRSCERETLAQSGLHMDERHVLPAPFPPYALLAFAAFSALPFRLATEVWLALDLLALAACVACVARLSAVRPVLVALAFVASAGFASLVIGQIVPLVLAALAYAALCARRGDGVGAALAMTVASLEPHLALPAWCGLLLFAPRTRVPLACAAAFLVAASLAAGPALNVEYVTQIVPSHARSELYNFAAQYSLSALLVTLGAAANVALRLGSLSYLLALAGGLWLGDLLRRRFDDAAFAVTTPVASVLLGGPFLHGHQLAAALPLGLMLVGRLRPRTLLYVATVAAVCALAVPWESLAESSLVADRLPLKAAAHAGPRLRVPAPNEPLERSYTAFMDAYAERSDPRTLAEQFATKLPTWYGLIAVLIAASALASGRRAVRAA
jgi:hypothetical protein